MSALLPAVPALAVVGCLVLFVAGMRLLRTDAVEGLDVGDLRLLRDAERSRVGGQGPLQRLARPLVPLLRRLMGAPNEARLKRMIELAGRPEGVSVESVLQRSASFLVVGLPGGVLLALQGRAWGIVAILGAAVILPVARIARLRRVRQDTISETLPDFLDVLSVTVSAGVGFRSALATVSDRFGGPLGEEVTLTLNQIRNGSSVREAFQKLRGRNDSEALSQFVSAFMQSEDLGAPLAQTLTRISEDTRRASAQAQRQKAARVAPRVTLVTSLVLVPGALVLLFTGFVLGSGVDFAAIAESLS